MLNNDFTTPGFYKEPNSWYYKSHLQIFIFFPEHSQALADSTYQPSQCNTTEDLHNISLLQNCYTEYQISR